MRTPEAGAAPEAVAEAVHGHPAVRPLSRAAALTVGSAEFVNPKEVCSEILEWS